MSKNVIVEAVETIQNAIAADETGFIRESVLLHLGGSAASNGAAPRKRAGRPAKEEAQEEAEETPRTTRRKRAKAKGPAAASEGGSLAKRILSFVKANPGSSSSAIADDLGSTSTELRPEINALLESKRLKKKGQKRGTTYYVPA